jgi:hypothetical protein
MKTKYILVLGGTAVLGVVAYLFFSNKKKKMEITTGEGSLNIQTSQLGGSTKFTGTANTGSGSTVSGGSSYSSSTQVPTEPYTADEAIAKSLVASTLISQYLSKISATQKNNGLNGIFPEQAEAEEKNVDYSLLRKNYVKLSDLIAYFKSKGAVIANNEFKNIVPTLSRANADIFIKTYPKLYLKRVLKDFPTYFGKHALDYELTPSEAIFVDEINYEELEKEQVNSWIVKTTPARIVIKDAFYGRGKNQIDIKGKLEELIRVGTYSYPATNEFAGRDPERGESKGTTVNYTIDGKPYTLTAFNSDTKAFNKNWGGVVAEGQIAVLIK